jgi:hypothetical protein
MPVPQLTHAQSRRRVAELKRAGCEVKKEQLPNGDIRVYKKCPELLENQSAQWEVRELGHSGSEWQLYKVYGDGSKEHFGTVYQMGPQRFSAVVAEGPTIDEWFKSKAAALRALQAAPNMRSNTALLENQVPAPNAVGYLVLAAFAGAALYAIFRPKKAAAAPTPPPPAVCTLETTEDFARLEAWSIAEKVAVVYLPATTTPPSPASSELAAGIVRAVTGPLGPVPNIIVVTSDGSFWSYESGGPVRTDLLRASFCNFKPAAAVSGIAWIGD